MPQLQPRMSMIWRAHPLTLAEANAGAEYGFYSVRDAGRLIILVDLPQPAIARNSTAATRRIAMSRKADIMTRDSLHKTLRQQTEETATRVF